jgi:hypothetical protein
VFCCAEADPVTYNVGFESLLGLIISVWKAFHGIFIVACLWQIRYETANVRTLSANLCGGVMQWLHPLSLF